MAVCLAVMSEEVQDRAPGFRAMAVLGPLPDLPAQRQPRRPVEGPQAFLIVSSPHQSGSAHFHFVDQFQVAVAGSGRVGKHEIRQGSVHYANAYTPYGPIVAGADGLSYLTLRNRIDYGGGSMPKSSALRKRGDGSLIAGRPRAYYWDYDPPHACNETVAGPYDDGLEVIRQLVGAKGDIAFAAPQGGGGQIGVVLAGEITEGDKRYPLWSCIFADAGDNATGLRAGRDGAELLVLRFPSPTVSLATVYECYNDVAATAFLNG